MKRQVEAIGELASSTSSKTLILPSDITGILGGLETLMHSMNKENKWIFICHCPIGFFLYNFGLF